MQKYAQIENIVFFVLFKLVKDELELSYFLMEKAIVETKKPLTGRTFLLYF